jgi:tetratricopeptide (TPR) repeat protein
VASVAELFSIYETTESLTEAKAALDRIATMEYPADLELGECYDGLAEAAADSGDYELAVQAQRLAVEHGCRRPDIAEDMLGWYLLKVGRKEEGEAVFAAALERRGHGPELHATIGEARFDSGDLEGALRAFDRALELTEAGSAVRLTERPTERLRVESLRAERQECRRELGLPDDEPGRPAPTVDREPPRTQEFVIAWFPREEIDAALGRWPSLADDLGDPDAYCGTIEGRLRDLRAATGRLPSVAPLAVEALVDFAAAHGLDPDTGEARSQFAAELGIRDEVIAWPPGRNDPCWCGSGRKYKRCCG